jgi:preprotein translocase subunit SecE
MSKNTGTIIKKIVPTGPEVLREALIVLGGVIIASLVISRVPWLKNLVTGASITVKDGQGNILN